MRNSGSQAMKPLAAMNSARCSDDWLWSQGSGDRYRQAIPRSPRRRFPIKQDLLVAINQCFAYVDEQGGGWCDAHEMSGTDVSKGKP